MKQIMGLLMWVFRPVVYRLIEEREARDRESAPTMEQVYRQVVARRARTGAYGDWADEQRLERERRRKQRAAESGASAGDALQVTTETDPPVPQGPPASGPVVDTTDRPLGDA